MFCTVRAESVLIARDSEISVLQCSMVSYLALMQVSPCCEVFLSRSSAPAKPTNNKLFQPVRESSGQKHLRSTEDHNLSIRTDDVDVNGHIVMYMKKISKVTFARERLFLLNHFSGAGTLMRVTWEGFRKVDCAPLCAAKGTLHDVVNISV